MKNQDAPAMAQSFAMTENECGTVADFLDDAENRQGFTKREAVLKDFMAAMIAKHGAYYANDLSTVAAMYVDDYFKELEK